MTSATFTPHRTLACRTETRITLSRAVHRQVHHPALLPLDGVCRWTSRIRAVQILTATFPSTPHPTSPTVTAAART